jgi:hypothetical protein
MFRVPLRVFPNWFSGFASLKIKFAQLKIYLDRLNYRFSTNLFCRLVFIISSQPQETTSILSSSGRKNLVPAQEALDPEVSRYNTVLAATCYLSLEFPREDISKALLLIEIEDLARNELKKIREAVDKSIKS